MKSRYLHWFLRYNGISCILNRLQSSVTITFICTGKPANLCDLLYCSGLEPNLQHLQGVPVFVECVKTCLQRIMEQVGHVEISRRCQLRRHQEGRAKRREGSQPNSICLWGGPTEVPCDGSKRGGATGPLGPLRVLVEKGRGKAGAWQRGQGHDGPSVLRSGV